MLAIGCNRAAPTGARPLRADKATDLLPPGAWARMSCGDGSKGRRWYSWAVLELQAEPDGPTSVRSPRPARAAQRHHRRAGLVPLLCPAAGRDRRPGPRGGGRWPVEENFQAAKGHAGLDEHQVRRRDSWHRWTTLAMLAHAFLTILATITKDTVPDHDSGGLVPITLGEARRLFTALTATASRTVERIWPGPLETTTPTPRPPRPLPKTRRQHHRSPAARSTAVVLVPGVRRSPYS